MKKRILTLSMCLALSATFASAANFNMPVNNVLPTIKAQPNTIMPLTPNGRPQITNVQQQLEARKRFEDKKARERELMYTTLGLTAEQKNKAESIDAKTRSEAGKYLRRIQIEARKLKDLKNKKAAWLEIHRQKGALKSAKKDADKYFASSRKAFESILTKEQLAKFKVIDKAKKQEFNDLKKQHKHGGPDYFGPKPPIGAGFEKMGPPPQGFGPKGPKGMEPVGPTMEDKK